MNNHNFRPLSEVAEKAVVLQEKFMKEKTLEQGLKDIPKPQAPKI